MNQSSKIQEFRVLTSWVYAKSADFCWRLSAGAILIVFTSFSIQNHLTKSFQTPKMQVWEPLGSICWYYLFANLRQHLLSSLAPACSNSPHVAVPGGTESGTGSHFQDALLHAGFITLFCALANINPYTFTATFGYRLAGMAASRK